MLLKLLKQAAALLREIKFDLHGEVLKLSSGTFFVMIVGSKSTCPMAHLDLNDLWRQIFRLPAQRHFHLF